MLSDPDGIQGNLQDQCLLQDDTQESPKITIHLLWFLTNWISSIILNIFRH